MVVYLVQPDLYCLCFFKTKLCQCEISVTKTFKGIINTRFGQSMVLNLTKDDEIWENYLTFSSQYNMFFILT
jgi:hypothetical protein